MTYYEILEINEKASPEVIRMAYKALCKKYHPDVYQGDKIFAEEKMKKINEAYDTLSDETKKRQYDYSINGRRPYNQRSYYEPRRGNDYQPKYERNVPNIDELLKKGFIALESGSWSAADIIFAQALKLDAEKAEAYLGKLMVDLHVKTRDALKNCSQSFYNYNNYTKAYSFADDSLRRFLEETIQFINKRNYEIKCNKIYCDACELLHYSNRIDDIQDAIYEFERIRGYKDSTEKIVECYQKIAEINIAVSVAEAERKKRKQEIKEKIKETIPIFKKIAIVVLPALILTVVAASILSKINLNGENVTSSLSDDATSNTTSENISSENSSSFVSSEEANTVSSSTITSSPTNKHPSSPSQSTSTSINTIPSTSTPSVSKPISPNTTSTSTPTSSIPELFKDSDFVSITEGDFTFEFYCYAYKPIRVEVTLTEYNGTSSNVNIPSTVAGYPVTNIGTAFRSNKSLISVNIPKTVKHISNEAFKDCSSLASITIPDGVTDICSETFAYCFSLKSAKIPSSVTYIESFAFAYCRSLASISIPYNVTHIGEAAFWFCESLTEVTIPNRVTTIENSVFNSCTSLASVIIPNSVTTIGPGAFTCCYPLKSIIIPDSITSIDDTAFEDCEKLGTVYFKSKSQMNKYAHLFDSSVELKILQ